MTVSVRPATSDDVEAIQAIYAHHVVHGLGTFEDVAPSVQEKAERVANVVGSGLPWLVAEDERSDVLGYAYAAPFRTRAAYRFTLEDSIYVRADQQRSGIGRALLDGLILACAGLGCRQLLAVIGDSGNHGSIALHHALGFQDAGVLRSVGFKHGVWVDVVMMQLALTG